MNKISQFIRRKLCLNFFAISYELGLNIFSFSCSRCRSRVSSYGPNSTWRLDSRSSQARLQWQFSSRSPSWGSSRNEVGASLFSLYSSVACTRAQATVGTAAQYGIAPYSGLFQYSCGSVLAGNLEQYWALEIRTSTYLESVSSPLLKTTRSIELRISVLPCQAVFTIFTMEGA